MLTKKQNKFIKSLQIKKYRDIEKCFLVEGEKNVVELLKNNWCIRLIVCSKPFASRYAPLLSTKDVTIEIIETKLLRSLGVYKSNEMAVSVVEKPKEKPFSIDEKKNILILDKIRDPGNLGTILRIAHWYGIEQVICSVDTTEVWNPKVVASSMGSILNVNVEYTDLIPILEKATHQKLITTLKGENIHQITLDKNIAYMIVMGNESKGVSAPVLAQADRKITIPGLGSADSLNVSVATGIICDNILRKLS